MHLKYLQHFLIIFFFFDHWNSLFLPILFFVFHLFFSLDFILFRFMWTDFQKLEREARICRQVNKKYFFSTPETFLKLNTFFLSENEETFHFIPLSHFDIQEIATSKYCKTPWQHTRRKLSLSCIRFVSSICI